MNNRFALRLILTTFVFFIIKNTVCTQESFSTVIRYDRSEERGIQILPFELGYLVCSNSSSCDNAGRSFRLDILDHTGEHLNGKQLDFCPNDQWAADITAFALIDTTIYVYLSREDSVAVDYDYNTYLASFDFNLDLQDVFPISSTELFDIPRSIKKSGDNLYLLEGRGQQGRGDSIRLIKVNTNGDVLGDYSIIPMLGEGNTPTLGLHLLSDNRFLINSRYFFLNGPPYAPQILIVDSVGRIIEEWGYQDMDLQVEGLRCYSSIQAGMKDEAFALSWCRDSFMGQGYFTRQHVVIHKYNNRGARMWETLVPMRYESEVFRIIGLSDNSLVCMGIGAHEQGSRGGWVFKLSPNGDILWNKVFTHMNDNFNSFFEGAVELANGSIGLVGTINNVNSRDTWVMVLDSAGCLENQCDSVLITSSEDLKEGNHSSSLEVYPNPSHDKVTLSYSSEFKPTALIIANAMGYVASEHHIQGNSGYFELSVSDFTPGVYIIILSNSLGQQLSEKIIISAID